MRGGKLVQPVVDEAPAAKGRTTKVASLAEVNATQLIDTLCQDATFEKPDGRRGGGYARIDPPRPVAETILSRVGQRPFPKVVGIITTPTLRPDGSILSEPGYDEATRLYHAADPQLRLDAIAHAGTRAAAEDGLRLLRCLLAEFPFVERGSGAAGVNEAVALSALVTVVARGAMSVAPLHVFRASTPGSGKSYLVDIASAIGTGRLCPVVTAGSTVEEMEKRFAGTLLHGFPIISIDNINGELGGDLLSQATTQPFLRLRPLGRSEIVEIETCSTILATGNNLRVHNDMVRRTMVCDLDAEMERPETRHFRGDPVRAVLDDRGRYVAACLAVVRGYLAAGQPGLLKLAGFDDWSALVRSALVWLGCADPEKSVEKARADDPELTALRELFAAWRTWMPVRTPLESRQMIEIATVGRQTHKADKKGGTSWEQASPELKDVLLRLAPGAMGEVNPNRLGIWLRKREGRIVDGHRIVRGRAKTSATRWSLEPVAEGRKAA